MNTIKKILFLSAILITLFQIKSNGQCAGSWSTTNTLNWLCATGPFLTFDLGANTCAAAAQSTFTFNNAVQNFKLTFSAFGTAGATGESRLSVFLNGEIIDLSLACNIIIGCQQPTGSYSIDNGCIVDAVSGNDGGISGYIYLDAGDFGLGSINSVGVAVSEPGSSGTIFQLDSCDAFPGCSTGISEPAANKSTVYPNPFYDQLSVMRDPAGEQTELTINDVYGRVVYDGKNSASNQTLSTADWNNGMYFYELRKKNKITESGKLVKY